MRALDTWVRTDEAPPAAPLLDVATEGTPAIRRDADGIALGGLRTPPVDVPVVVLSGVAGPTPSLLCLLLGSTKPLPESRIAALYPSRAAYQQRYDDDTARAIDAGYVLEADRDALLGFAQPSRVSE